MQDQAVPAQLRRALHRRMENLLQRAMRHYGVNLPAVKIGLDIRGTVAGCAYPAELKVRFNPVLLQGNPEGFLHEVVAHEIAHLVAFQVHGRRIRPHGPEWAAVMNLYGVEPRRCHGFDIDRIEVRRQRRHRYLCACNEHALSTTRHNRVRRGEQQYLCRRCGETLVELPKR